MNAAFGVRLRDRVAVVRLAAALPVDRADADRLAVARDVVRPAALLVLLRLADVVVDVFLAVALLFAVLLALPVVLDRALVVLVVRFATLAGMVFAPEHECTGSWRRSHGPGPYESLRSGLHPWHR